jgi:hypothetical protein
MVPMTDAPPADRAGHTRPELADAASDGGSLIGPEQGGGPPVLMPWTLVVDGEWEADLEHGAPLPRVGDRVEFIADGGDRRAYLVTAVVHTVQRSSSTRPTVREEREGPNSTLDGATDDPPPVLRAGLPRVIVRPAG